MTETLKELLVRWDAGEAQVCELEDVLRRMEANDTSLTSPWPPRDTVAKLVDATEHLLKDHDCDRLGYEGVCAARDAARVWLDKTLQVDLHPTGRCTCSGEGRCEWCLALALPLMPGGKLEVIADDIFNAVVAVDEAYMVARMKRALDESREVSKPLPKKLPRKLKKKLKKQATA